MTSRNLKLLKQFLKRCIYVRASLGAQIVKNPGLDPWVGKIPWRRAWQPTPVFLPGESPWTE